MNKEQKARVVALTFVAILAVYDVKRHLPQLFEPETTQDTIARLESSASRNCTMPSPYDQLCAMEKAHAADELARVRNRLHLLLHNRIKVLE